MSKRKLPIVGSLVLVVLGAVALWGGQQILKATNSPAFCVSCHSMEHPRAEWEGSSHFSNAKGIRAECADCHVPQDGTHYLKAKVTALKDLWYTMTNKLPDKAAYEAHRAEMAQRVWDEMKENDSMTCRSCHSLDAMELSEQTELAQQSHTNAKANGQTCIDCHKGLVHFLPETTDNAAGANELAKHSGQFATTDKTLYTLAISTAQVIKGGEARLMPFAELNNWKENNDKINATIQGWQQVGAESLVYMDLGKRITVAVLDEDAKANVTTVKTVHDEVTDSDWKQVAFDVNLAKADISADLNALNVFGQNLNQTHCSGCHAPISADHYTANQWIGVVNSMKDRTSMTDEQVRALTIYLQRNAKDMK